MYLGNQEKLKILYLYFSVDLKIPLQSRGNEERTHKGNTQKTPRKGIILIFVDDYLKNKVVFDESIPSKILPKYFNQDNYSTHISNENTTTNKNSFNNQQNYDNQIDNAKFNLSYENNAYLNQNNDDDDFELISYHSSENIIDKINTNYQTEKTFDEFRDNINYLNGLKK
ncbi:hypothetical protein H8356DRAFT_1359835 [Neocallimastix lanati (nom. inval.)]|nr:hypothetical protein H8356DRAFT_1359835 [Neocallimastix sp. JGI-2020a]